MGHKFKMPKRPEENFMRKLVIALASVAALGLALPAVSAPAEAHDRVVVKKKVVIKKHYGHDRGRHLGWSKHKHHRHGHHRHHGHRHGGATVIIR
jgi:hypothetical protein